MTDTIREQIIQALITGFGAVTTDNGYNSDAGTTVKRAWPEFDPVLAPLINVFPGSEEMSKDQYGNSVHTMTVTAEASAEFDEDQSEVAEALLGDLIECATAIVYSLPFTDGSAEIMAAQALTGKTSGATAWIQAVTVVSGTWAGGDAAGTLTLRRLIGSFGVETLQVGGADKAVTTGVISGQYAETRMTGGLAKSINCTSAGEIDHPPSDAQLAGQQITLEIVYETLPGNPYATA